MPTFERVSRYPFPRETVFDWHLRPGAFQRLTPPGMATLLHGPTDGINPGSEILLRMSHPLVAGLLPELSWRGRRGPIGLDWRVRHTELVPGERFVDEQVSGPFRRWRHEHLFSDGPGGSTVLTDRIHWELPAGVHRVAGPVVEMQLDALFSFRERNLRGDLLQHERLDATRRRVVVAGASGLIGTQLCALLTSGGHEVVRLVRSDADAAAPDAVRWDPAAGHVPVEVFADADAVVNLAGATIGGRFSRDHKAAVLRSRLDVTNTLVDALRAAGSGAAYVQASGIGVYGARRPGELLTEESSSGDGFLAEVVRQWEAAGSRADAAGVRTAFLRTGVVLAEAGGSLLRQVPLFSFGVGGRLGPADGYLSWIGLDDTARVYLHAIASEVEGPVNAVAPRPVTHQQFAETLGRVMHRPAWLPTPPIGPKVVVGAEGYDQIVDIDQRVSCRRLVESGFRFAQPNLADALRHALMR